MRETQPHSAAASQRRFSVIIPTWNEARALPALISRLHGSPWVSEIIVADHASEDGTPEIALAAGCRVVPGGRPAAGRNAGAAVAREELLLFVDADAVVTVQVLSALTDHFADAHVNLVHFPLFPLTSRRFIHLCYRVMDHYFTACDRLRTCQGVGTLIAVRSSVFRRVGGFDETILAGEDAYFIREVGRRAGGVCYSHRARVEVSARRFLVEPAPLFVAKTVLWGFLRLIGSRRSLVGYRWKRYDQAEGSS
ncbi:glycosyltransferase [Streptomyces sp. NPDC007205]|uniref:glycosyltransferase n=1 Tax=Streptomyces sp. NPDC007205 TaxID=3154316 RepID=UPI0033E6F1D2